MRNNLLILALLTILQISAQTKSLDKIQFNNEHPSILINAADLKQIRASVKDSRMLSEVHKTIIKESDALLTVPVLKYEKIGKRLLLVSRECIRRVFYLSYAYQYTGEKNYAVRAEEEMLAVSEFSDWNPSHFLDVAEMTLAVSIGYDWLYKFLPESSRSIIAEAIVEKGLKPSLESKYNWFLKVDDNWNQVCNAGMTFGALAIRNTEPALAKEIIERSLKSILVSMPVYEPEGNFPEGYGYWDYGTTFNVLFVSSLNKLFGENFFPVSDKPGFMKTGSFMLNMVGPNNLFFNFSDVGGGGKMGFNPAMFWFAKQNKDVNLLLNEHNFVSNNLGSLAKNRMLPAAIVWGADLNCSKIVSPSKNYWIGNGTNPICLMRTSWTDKNAIFVGFKGGSQTVNHSHMDVGSFVMDANGVRWAGDLGMENYTKLEEKGLDIWSRKQNSQRWQVFRYTNYVHNTLTFNDSLQRVMGVAKIQKVSDNVDNMAVSSDLSGVYEGQVKKVVRQISIVNQSYVSVKDELEGLSNATKVRWTMLTEAEPKLLADLNTIELKKNGKRLLLKVNSPLKIELKTWSTKSPKDYDSPNPGSTLVGSELNLPANAKAALEVTLTPQP